MQPRPSPILLKGARQLSGSPLAWRKADVVKYKLGDFQVLFGAFAVITYKRITFGYYNKFMISKFL